MYIFFKKEKKMCSRIFKLDPDLNSLQTGFEIKVSQS